MRSSILRRHITDLLYIKDLQQMSLPERPREGVSSIQDPCDTYGKTHRRSPIPKRSFLCIQKINKRSHFYAVYKISFLYREDFPPIEFLKKFIYLNLILIHRVVYLKEIYGIGCAANRKYLLEVEGPKNGRIQEPMKNVSLQETFMRSSILRRHIKSLLSMKNLRSLCLRDTEKVFHLQKIHVTPMERTIEGLLSPKGLSYVYIKSIEDPIVMRSIKYLTFTEKIFHPSNS